MTRAIAEKIARPDAVLYIENSAFQQDSQKIDSALDRLEQMVVRLSGCSKVDGRFITAYESVVHSFSEFLSVFSDGMLNDAQSSRFKNIFELFLISLDDDNVVNKFSVDLRRVASLALKNCDTQEFSLPSHEDTIAKNDFICKFGLVLRAAIESLFSKLCREEDSRDGLTGLLNRRYGDQLLIKSFGEQVASLKKEQDDSVDTKLGSKRGMVVVFFDFDRFKSVNDKYGHDVGDQVLKAGSRAIAESVRPSDIVSRWGGEEFVVALKDVTFEEAVKIVKRISEAVSANVAKACPQLGHKQTVSIGFVSTSDVVSAEHPYDIHDYVDFADKAVYDAKISGRDSIVYVGKDGRRYMLEFKEDGTFKSVPCSFLNTRLRRLKRFFGLR